MSGEKDDLMRDGEKRFHHRLALLDAFDGEIKSAQKFHKSLWEYREETEGLEQDDWYFTHAPFGPADPGLSAILYDYDKLGLVLVDKEDEVWVYRETKQGSRFVRGVKRGLRLLRKDMTEEREKSLELIAKMNKDEVGNQIANRASIKEKKDEPFGIDQ